MTMVVSLNRERGVEWSVLSRALPGQSVSGDMHALVPTPSGFLVGVIDGLGHGDEAILAARLAADELHKDPTAPVERLVQSCHRALRNSRGAAMTLISVDCTSGTASAVGVGNVEAIIVRSSPDAIPARESVLLRNGVVGYQLPALQASVFPISPGDVIVLATDGVRSDFADAIRAGDALPEIVERLLECHGKGTDDALALACRVLRHDED